MIKVETLYKYYGSRRALGPLSAEIDDGEVVGLLGLNGAGKTTTLRILACDLLPSNGTVRVGGHDVVEQPDRVRRLVGYLPDTPPLYEEMTVRRYLAFAAKLRGVASGDVASWVERATGLTGLTARIDEVIGTLSHGYRQRVGIAQAIVHKPKLVVLDEPSSGLDPVQILEMRQLVRSLGGEHTVLVSSHNLPEISEMCDRLLVMGHGRIVASGTQAELVDQWAQSNSLRLTIGIGGGRTKAQAEQCLTGVEGVTRVEVHRAQEPGEESVSFGVFCQADVRANLARAVVEQGFELLSLARAEGELEAVFSKLAFADSQEEAA